MQLFSDNRIKSGYFGEIFRFSIAKFQKCVLLNLYQKIKGGVFMSERIYYGGEILTMESELYADYLIAENGRIKGTGKGARLSRSPQPSFRLRKPFFTAFALGL